MTMTILFGAVGMGVLGFGASGCSGPPRYEASTGPLQSAEQAGAGPGGTRAPVVQQRTAGEEAEVKAVIRAYVDAWNKAYSTHDPAPMSRYTTKDCADCQKYAKDIEHRATEGKYVGARPEHRIVFRSRLVGERPITIEADFVGKGSKYVYRDGGTVESKGGSTRYRFVMVQTPKGWLIDNFSSIEGEEGLGEPSQ